MNPHVRLAQHSSECLTGGLTHHRAETGLHPSFYLAQLAADRVPKSTGQSNRQNKLDTLRYLLEGLRNG